MTAVYGDPFVYGIPDEVKPVVGLGPGKIRIRMRQNSPVFIFHKTPEGLDKYYVKDMGNFWMPSHKTATNQNGSRKIK